jgi:hypothetical protein
VASAAVAPAGFAGSGLTRAVLRGADFVGVPAERDWTARVSQVVETARSHPLTYVYERGLDHQGHLRGWQSPSWRHQLAGIDTFLGRMLDALPADTAVLVTGDHGMVDVPRAHRLFIEDEPVLAQGVDLIGGEARLRHLYTEEPDAVAHRWSARLGTHAEVRTRSAALPWFGSEPPTDEVARRIGDVVVAMLDDWAMLTLTRAGEASLVGMHGSITPRERGVPLLTTLV